MRTCAVTGGAGFIGSALARRLVARGDRVFVLDDLSTGFKRNVPEGAAFHQVDLSDARALARIADRPDIVFHLAAQSSGEASFDDPRRDVAVNYGATYNVLSWARECGCRRFVFSSSMSVYGDVPAAAGPVREEYPVEPASYYGCNKLASEKMIGVFCKTASMEYAVLRLFNVYGPGQNMLNMKQGMVSIYLSYLMSDRPIEVKGSLERARDFVYVEDAVDALALAAEASQAAGRVFNVGTGVKTPVRALLREVLKAYGREDWDAWVKVAGRTSGDVTGFSADISLISRQLGWKPKWPLSRGIPEMKKWVDETLDFWRRSA